MHMRCVHYPAMYLVVIIKIPYAIDLYYSYNSKILKSRLRNDRISKFL